MATIYRDLEKNENRWNLQMNISKGNTTRYSQNKDIEKLLDVEICFLRW